MNNAFRLLKLCAKHYPPDKTSIIKRHVLVIKDNKLCLVLHYGGRWHDIFITDEDLEKPIDILFGNIKKLVQKIECYK